MLNRLLSIAIFLFILTPHLHASPQRIISISPVVTEIIYDLGLGDRVIAVSEWCNYPASVNALPKVGGQSPNLERMIELEPDIVIGMDNAPHVEKKLNDLNITIEMYDTPKSVSDIYKTIMTIAEVLDAKTAGAALVNRLKMELKALEAPPQTPGPRVLVLIWDSPLMSIGNTSYIHELLTLAGGDNVLSDVSLAAPVLSQEALIDARPDIIIATRPKIVTTLQHIPALRESLVNNGTHIHTIQNTDIVARPGPRFIDGIRDLRQTIFHD